MFALSLARPLLVQRTRSGRLGRGNAEESSVAENGMGKTRAMGQVVPFASLVDLGQHLHARGQRIVFTNGHFDLLHPGHVRLLQTARTLGDVLIVGINTDETAQQRKGPGRPILPESARAELLAALACVDYVTIFPHPTAEEAIRILRPDVYVKGGDYAATPDEEAAGKTPLPEAAIVRSYGGQVVILPLVPGWSTTAIVRRILDAYCPGQSRDAQP